MNKKHLLEELRMQLELATSALHTVRDILEELDVDYPYAPILSLKDVVNVINVTTQVESNLSSTLKMPTADLTTTLLLHSKLLCKQEIEFVRIVFEYYAYVKKLYLCDIIHQICKVEDNLVDEDITNEEIRLTMAYYNLDTNPDGYILFNFALRVYGREEALMYNQIIVSKFNEL